MIFPPFLFLISRMGNYPCIYLFFVLGDEGGRFESTNKNGATSGWRLPQLYKTLLSEAYLRVKSDQKELQRIAEFKNR